MSKLYLQGGTDARKTALTARGHKHIHMAFLYNWKGGNVAQGAVECDMSHRGDKVIFTMRIKGTNDYTFITFHPDGTYDVSKG